MSMQVPLVTFAVGGIGEYVEAPEKEKNPKSPNPYSISSNAVIVNIASPDAVAEAVLLLINDSNLRRSIGKKGRETIESYFTIKRQMEQYSVLYRELVG
jgi:glycosyltransferase involved in cell wall biosynthesis